ncbi:MAG: endonuclease/exonuclease/phosphatase family protein [Candidatus Heimdallarchaeota archaeon]|nr:endonuclease/exonuclease/phosphatase family protein [Candidatus Heimdallarchaeota archaeon]
MNINRIILPILFMIILSIPIYAQAEPLLVIDENEFKGLVIVDDLHMNDYSDGSMFQIKTYLEEQGYMVGYSSEFSSFADSLSNAHYLIVTAPYEAISNEDIQAIYSWFESSSRNLLLASRGDYEVAKGLNYNSINSILSTLEVDMRAQDDNIYTSDISAYQPWYIETENFNSNYSNLFEGVDLINFFSPSSVSYGSPGDVLVYASSFSYQDEQGGSAPETIYDNVDDDTGGDSIPLAVYEETTIGSEVDRVITVGTTLWADYDYRDFINGYAQDTVFLSNILDYFTNETLSAISEIPDVFEPDVEIASPHLGATLFGTVTLDIDARDPSGISSVEIYIDNDLKSNSSSYVWNTDDYADGSHTVKVVAEDSKGNSKEISQLFTIQHDFTPSLNEDAKVMAYNIKESGIYPEWLDVVKEENPDILMLVETGDFDDNSDELLEEYKLELNNYFIDEINYEAYTLQGIADAWNGISLYSRYTIKESNIIDTVNLDNGAPRTIPLPFLEAVISVNNIDVTLIGTHLSCCSDGLDNRLKEMEGIINYMDSLGDVPIIMLGDFNSESPDDNIADPSLGTEPIDMLVNKDHAKASTVHTFTDVHVFSNPSDAGATFPSYDSRIDYIFVNRHFKDRIESSTTGDTESADRGSDHFSIDVILDLADFDLAAIETTESTSSSSPQSSASNTQGSPISSTYALFALVITNVIILHRRKRKY